MKKILFLSISIFIFISVNAQKIKKYPFKSGIIEYKCEGNRTGTETMYWDEYGHKEYHIRNLETKTSTEVEKSVEHILYIGVEMYSWEDGKEAGMKIKNPILETMEEDPNMTWEQLSKNVLTNLGYKKVGSETVAGKKCEVWQGMSKAWIWKGLTIKTDANILGVKITQTATDINTGARVSSSKFELPDNIEFPDNFEEMERQSKENAGTNSGEDQAAQDSVVKEVKTFIKGLGKMLGGSSDDN